MGGLKKASFYAHFKGLTTDSYLGSQITTRGTVNKGYYIGTYRNCHILSCAPSQSLLLLYSYYIHIYNIITMYMVVCLRLMFVKVSCRNMSMTITSLSICGLFMHLPFLEKTCSSGMQLTMHSDSNTLWTSQMFIFLSLPVQCETSSYLVPISLMTLKIGMYFASQFDFLSKCLIIINSPILYCGKSSYLSNLLRTCLFCIRCC